MATLNLSAGQLNGKAVAGDDIDLVYEFPFDMTGWGGKLVVRTSKAIDGTALATLTHDGSGASALTITPGALSSTVSGRLPASATYGNAYSKVFHALQLTSPSPSSKKRTWIDGEIQLAPGLVSTT